MAFDPSQQHVVLPGSFVVNQGMSGDGIVNTIDSRPDFVPPSSQQQQQQQQQPSQEKAITEWQRRVMSTAKARGNDFVQRIQQHRHPQSSKLPILSQMGSTRRRWWTTQGQLWVFKSMPPGHATSTVPERYDNLLLPGVSVQVKALHTWEWQQPQPSSTQQPYWKYQGVCASSSSRLPPQHLPAAGRVQYLELDDTVPTTPHGFVIYSVDGYNFLTSLQSDNVEELQQDVWWWKVVSPWGAIVRQGPSVSSPITTTLPYGTTGQVSEKVQLHDPDTFNNEIVHDAFFSVKIRARLPNSQVVEGWCCEQEHVYLNNPPFGKRVYSPSIPEWLPILQPIPMPTAMLWEVVGNDGDGAAIVQNGKSEEVTQLSRGTKVPVLGQDFAAEVTSLSPSTRRFRHEQFVPRLCLAVKSAYASVKVENSQLQWKPTGQKDPAFDPFRMGQYHWQRYCQYESLSSRKPTKKVAKKNKATKKQPKSNGSNSGECSRLTECTVCMEKPANAAFVHKESGHVCCCVDCAHKCFQNERGKCPICQQPIKSVIELFF